MVTDLKVVRATELSKLTRRIRKALFNIAAKVTQYDGICGYAVVTWDDRGEPTINVWGGKSSPVADELIPTYVFSQLSRYVALQDAENKTIETTKE